jgi:release factor glutamine methyltransferase
VSAADRGATITWRALLAGAAERIGSLDEARWIAQAASGRDLTEWILGLDDPATERAVAHLDAMVARRAAGEPVQYVIGSWPFRRVELMVDARVLIPRPETEEVVEVVLELVRSRPAPHTIADLGTGSGAIALSLAHELPLGSATVWATDVSTDALDVARANLAGLGRAAAHVRVAHGSWYEALPPELMGSLDLLVANPPYVAPGDDMDDAVAMWEPALALWSGDDGLRAIAEIVDGAARWLRPGGWLVLEIGASQGEAVKGRMEAAGLQSVAVRPDAQQRDRVAIAQRAVDHDPAAAKMGPTPRAAGHSRR